MTQRTIVKDLLQQGVATIADLFKRTEGISYPSFRRAVYDAMDKGEVVRLARGVYALKSDESIGYIQCGDALEALKDMVATGTELKFKMVFLDIPYYSPALIGRNRRKHKDQYDFITPEYFGQLCYYLKQIVNAKSSVFLMLSGARTAQPDMNKYLMAAKQFFHMHSEGAYTKLYQDGSPVLNIRGVPAAPERLILMTTTPVLFHWANPDLNYSRVRPTGYNTEKHLDLLTGLMAACTCAGDWMLDLFAGSGVAGLAASLMGLNFILVEKSQGAIDNYIIPKLNRW
jgi:16S rRNA G966 N2-methylase RsmD